MSTEQAAERLRDGFGRWRRRAAASLTVARRSLVERRWLLVSWLGLGGVALAQAGMSTVAIAVVMAAVIAGAGFWPLTRSEVRTSGAARHYLRQRRTALQSEQWRGVLETLTDAALLLSNNGTILMFNVKATELFDNLRQGVPAVAIVRNPEFAELLRQVDGPEIHSTAIFGTRVPLERRLATSAGRIPQVLDQPDEPALLITFRDLSEQERLDRMRTDFIANASHELRSPLASVLGFIETLQGPARDDADARERFLGIMAAQARRMKRLIDDLMSLTRVEMHQHLRPRDPIDVNDLVTHVAEGFEPLAAEANVRLIVTPSAMPCTALGDWDELAQVFQNLIQNALRYGRPGGTVTITTTRWPADGTKTAAKASTADLSPEHYRPNDAVAVSVADDGPGIAAQHLPRLTERFYRVESPGSRDRDGTGLGLAIVKHIMNRHRGELRIESEVGRGSTFTVVLPGTVEQQSTGQNDA
jgi:two-component system, OmpR family, phosphate regulon sensor histidine kinase PhoR